MKARTSSRALVRACVCAALGREAVLRRELEAARRAGTPAADLKEALLQTYLFAGFPRAINALWILDEVYGGGAVWRERGARRWRSRGERLCRRIYGRHYDAMMRRMRRLHPDLADWILLEGYGKTLGRPYFDAAARESLIIPVLVALGTWRQIPSHVEGLLNVGGTREQLREALDAAAGLAPAAAIRRCRNLAMAIP